MKLLIGAVAISAVAAMDRCSERSSSPTPSTSSFGSAASSALSEGRPELDKMAHLQQKRLEKIQWQLARQKRQDDRIKRSEELAQMTLSDRLQTSRPEETSNVERVNEKLLDGNVEWNRRDEKS